MKFYIQCVPMFGMENPYIVSLVSYDTRDECVIVCEKLNTAMEYYYFKPMKISTEEHPCLEVRLPQIVNIINGL